MPKKLVQAEIGTALMGFMDAVSAAKYGRKAPAYARGVYGPKAAEMGAKGVLAMLPKQKFQKPAGPTSTGSVESAIRGGSPGPSFTKRKASTEQIAARAAGRATSGSPAGSTVTVRPSTAPILFAAGRKKKRRYA